MPISARIRSKTSPTTHPYQLRSKSNTRGTPFRALAARHLLAQQIFEHRINHIYDAKGSQQSLKHLLLGLNKDIWTQSLSNELGCLLKGNNAGVASTDSIEFIAFPDVPSDKKVTYANFVCEYRPLKVKFFVSG